METRRLNFVDAMKGIGIIFVIVGHVSMIQPLNMFLYAFRMPLFFFVSVFSSQNRSILSENARVVESPICFCREPVYFVIDRFFPCNWQNKKRGGTAPVF